MISTSPVCSSRRFIAEACCTTDNHYSRYSFTCLAGSSCRRKCGHRRSSFYLQTPSVRATSRSIHLGWLCMLRSMLKLFLILLRRRYRASSCQFCSFTPRHFGSIHMTAFPHHENPLCLLTLGRVAYASCTSNPPKVASSYKLADKLL